MTTLRTPRQEWWTAAELAEAGLPDLPGSKRGVGMLAERQSWATRPGLARRRAGRGGGVEYHWTLLPARAQAKLLAAGLTPSRPAEPVEMTGPARPDRDAAWAWFEGLAGPARAKAHARLATLLTAQALEAGGLTRQLAVQQAAEIDGVSPRSVWTWLDLVSGVRRDDWLPYLAPRHSLASRTARRTEIDPRFGDLLRADVLRDSQPSITSCYDRVRRLAEAEGTPVPPIHTARRWLKRTVSHEAWVLGRKGLEALKRLHPPAVRDKTALHAMEAINADFHKFDVFVRFPKSPGGEGLEVQRPQMVAIQDIYSGRILAWGLDRTANSHAVQLCFGQLIERWGIPEHVLLDNGREFAAKAITGGAKTRFRFRVRETDPSGLLTSLGCQVHWATPYSGQSKPIERAFRDLCDRIAKHPAFVGAYTGNSPTAKPESYGQSAVEFDLFRRIVAEEIELHNARPDRRSEVAMGRSFAAVFDESYATAPIRKATPEQRRLWLLGAEGVRTHSSTGQVRFMGNSYWADWMVGIAGQRIVARFDRAALWDGIHVYALDDRYLGHAPCLAKTGFFDLDDARSHARARRDWEKAQKAELAAHRRLTAADVAGGLATLAVPAAPAPEARVIRGVFNAPSRRAVRPSPVEPAAQAEVAAVMALDARRPVRTDDAGRELFVRARGLERAIDAGAVVTKEQRRWLEGFRQTPEYRSWAQIEADFGEEGIAG